MANIVRRIRYKLDVGFADFLQGDYLFGNRNWKKSIKTRITQYINLRTLGTSWCKTIKKGKPAFTDLPRRSALFFYIPRGSPLIRQSCKSFYIFIIHTLPHFVNEKSKKFYADTLKCEILIFVNNIAHFIVVCVHIFNELKLSSSSI